MEPRRRSWPFYVLVAFCMLLVVGAYVGFLAWFQPDSHHMDRDVAAIRKLGIPTEVSEVAALVPQGGTDANDDYQQFGRIFQQLTLAQRRDVKTLKGRDLKSVDARVEASVRLGPIFKTFIAGTQEDQWDTSRLYKNPDPLVRDQNGEAQITAILDGADTFIDFARALERPMSLNLP